MKKLFLIMGSQEIETNKYVDNIASRHCECMTYCDTKTLNMDECIENIKKSPTQAVLISGFPENTIQMKQLDETLEKEADIELVMVMELLENSKSVQKHNEIEVLSHMREFYKQKKVYKSLNAEASPDNVCAMMEIAIYSRADMPEY